MSIREVQVRNLAELIESMTPVSPDRQSGRLRESAVYRGMGDVKAQLWTSLDRLGTPASPPHAKGHLEEHLMRNFMKYSRPYLAAAPSSNWEFLVVAQHHGLPTRLLDWTYSPLAAAHFATIGGMSGSDRVIWRLDWKRVHDRFRLPDRAVTVEDLDQVLHERGLESTWDLFNCGKELSSPFVCMLEPPALDERIGSQSATFTLSSDKTRSLNAILGEAGLSSALTRLLISAAAAELIRDQLDLCGVDERRLFPGLDGVAAQMRRYYSASASQALQEAQDHVGRRPE